MSSTAPEGEAETEPESEVEADPDAAPVPDAPVEAASSADGGADTSTFGVTAGGAHEDWYASGAGRPGTATGLPVGGGGVAAAEAAS
ncbi:hypothetical protein H8N01_11600 [Streptomyces sp. AC536]|uniref:hypothetical protein n=1 Tax=Streptomyces buecherae TaxID=2763006 RepID=UPI00164CF5E9|nr:hypothetical protein [Streptomyces buecherae]QNJ39765.1 hypothetical protein H7H31_07630 [Streptomyces buecherae]